jgi:hypothetical protein
MRGIRAIFGLALATVSGCQTVHTSREGAVPVAMWTAPGLIAPEGQRVDPEARDIVARILRDSGLHPVVDNGGVSVPEVEETAAREALLTDARLKKTDVVVILGIPAGTGRRTANGFEVPAIVPAAPMQMPSNR